MAAVFYPKMPQAELYSESLLSIDLLGENTANLVMQIKNPNRYASEYSCIHLFGFVCVSAHCHTRIG